jgi:hypothetical protein
MDNSHVLENLENYLGDSPPLPPLPGGHVPTHSVQVGGGHDELVLHVCVPNARMGSPSAPFPHLRGHGLSALVQGGVEGVGVGTFISFEVSAIACGIDSTKRAGVKMRTPIIMAQSVRVCRERSL